MIYQIAGTVIVSISIICFTAWCITVRRDKQKNHEFECKRRNAHNERMFSNNSMMLYEDERQRRIAAETREGIARDQLKRSRHENERLLKLLAQYEEDCGLHRRAV